MNLTAKSSDTDILEKVISAILGGFCDVTDYYYSAFFNSYIVFEIGGVKYELVVEMPTLWWLFDKPSLDLRKHNNENSILSCSHFILFGFIFSRRKRSMIKKVNTIFSKLANNEKMEVDREQSEEREKLIEILNKLGKDNDVD